MGAIVLEFKSISSLRNLSEGLKMVYKHNKNLSSMISNKQSDKAIMQKYFKDKMAGLLMDMEVVNEMIEIVEIEQMTLVPTVNELATNEKITRNKDHTEQAL